MVGGDPGEGGFINEYMMLGRNVSLCLYGCVVGNGTCLTLDPKTGGLNYD